MHLLTSRYVIDGVAVELTPSQLLGDFDSPVDPVAIVDESTDPEAGVMDMDPSRTEEYLNAVLSVERQFPVPYAADFTRARIAGALIDSLFRQGCPRLEDLPVTLKWVWNTSLVGNAAAFYSSAEAAADYIDGLGVNLRRFSVAEGPLEIKVATPFSGAPLQSPDKFISDSESWIIYIPFDTSEYSMGGSLLAQSLESGAGRAPQIGDPDYFMDCFELVQELVHDGVAVAGASVGDGGLLAALKRLCSDKVGASVDISDIVKAGKRRDVVSVNFAEVPGVVLQVRDIDFDYIDAECLLQDVAYYPLGHPVPGNGDVRVKSSANSGLQNILASITNYYG